MLIICKSLYQEGFYDIIGLGDTMKKLLILIPLIFLITGCVGVFGDRLDTPSNIRYNSEYLIWDSVNEADYYLILLGDETYVSFENRFSTFDLASGDYRVRIQASTGDRSSRFSSVYDLKLERLYDHPKNLTYRNYTLSFDHVEPTEGYIIEFLHQILEDRIIIYDSCNSDRCSFEIDEIDSLKNNHVYEVRVAGAYTATGEASILGYEYATSLFTKPIKIHTYYEPLRVYNHTISLINVSDTVIDIDESFSIRDVFYLDNAVSASNFTIVNNTIIINNAFIETLNVGLNQVVLITNLGRIDINLYKLES